MANAKKCDRCNQYYDNDDHMRKEFNSDPTDKYSEFRDLVITTRSFDMCEDCVKSVLCSKYNLNMRET